METPTIKLLFEKESYMEMVSMIIDKDNAFLYSLLKLTGCKECPKSANVKLGVVNKNKKENL